jgi:hypothetical protein
VLRDVNGLLKYVVKGKEVNKWNLQTRKLFVN